jgi:hypothetical protein
VVLAAIVEPVEAGWLATAGFAFDPCFALSVDAANAEAAARPMIITPVKIRLVIVFLRSKFSF